jgi:RhtB (resistance to homoserine/threonine) family protein
MDVHLWAFIGVAALLIVTPGPDMALVTKNAVVYGRRVALGTAVGVNTGLLVWTVFSALGVAALVQASAVAFTVLKLVGAAYLIWLGVQALRAARQRSPHGLPSTAEARRQVPAALGFRQGLISDVANPKVAAFFTSLLPQFASGRHGALMPLLLLGGLFVLMTIVWLCCYAVAAAKASGWLQRPSVNAALDRLTGIVLVGLGLRLATEHR